VTNIESLLRVYAILYQLQRMVSTKIARSA